MKASICSFVTLFFFLFIRLLSEKYADRDQVLLDVAQLHIGVEQSAEDAPHVLVFECRTHAKMIGRFAAGRKMADPTMAAAP